MKKSLLILTIAVCYLTGYGQQIGNFTDPRDGKVYKTVKIGNQTWFSENLAFKTDSGCYAYDNNDKFAAIYGYMYKFRVAEKECPPGWHLPSDLEWKQLISYLGGDSIAATKLKATHGWNSKDGLGSSTNPAIFATNSSGFSALPGGYYYLGDTVVTSKTCPHPPSFNQAFDRLGERTYFWGSYVTEKDVATSIMLYYNLTIVWWGPTNAVACYVRCIKD
jgi:uncharacterized protein (TIGR02145 family)